MNELSKEELQPISIAEARRIMGSPSQEMTDEGVENLIYNLTFIARMYVRKGSINE